LEDKEILKTYIVLRTVDHPIGVREAQRILNLSSPGKSQRILRKLVKMGLATRLEDGKYLIIKDPPLELIGKIIIRGRLFPKILVLGVYMTSFSITYVLLTKPSLETIILLTLLNIPIWLEAINEYREIRKRWS